MTLDIEQERECWEFGHLVTDPHAEECPECHSTDLIPASTAAEREAEVARDMWDDVYASG